MTRKNLTVYYLEDDPLAFTKIKELLLFEGVSVYPKTRASWADEITLAQSYLKTSDEKRIEFGAKLQQVLLGYSVDLFIMDLYLEGNNAQVKSSSIFRELMQTQDRIKKIPVIFLTRKDDSEVPVGSYASYVKRPDILNDENGAKVVTELFVEVERFGELIVKMEEGVGCETEESTKLTFSNWLRRNF